MKNLTISSAGLDKIKLGDLLAVKSGKGFKASEYSLEGRRLLQIENVSYGFVKWNEPSYLPEDYSNSVPDLILQEGDIVLALNRPITNGQLKIARLTAKDAGAILYQRVGKVISRGVVSYDYLYHLIGFHIKKFVESKSIGSDQPFISIRELYQHPLSVVSSQKEQQETAEFLTSVDNKISQLTEKHRLLNEYKKGVMQQIFSQQLRFKDEDGNAFLEWEDKHFGDVFTRVTTKNKENNENVLTISAQKGLISQLEYFNKSVAAKDVSGYYLLHKGDFAYNKSYSQGYPMGAIKPLKRYEKGVVSTLYICFRPKAKFSGAYFEQFFDAGMLNREIAKIAQEGARNHGLLNVSVKEFFDDIKLTVPTLDEQKKIAQFLQSIDTKIEGVVEQIEQTKQFKKGLLQQMFV